VRLLTPAIQPVALDVGWVVEIAVSIIFDCVSVLQSDPVVLAHIQRMVQTALAYQWW